MTEHNPCCSASRGEARPSREHADRTTDGDDADGAVLSTFPATAGDDRTSSMVRVGGETFEMGTDSDVGFPEDGEGPAREVFLDPFYIDGHAVTNSTTAPIVTSILSEVTDNVDSSARAAKSRKDLLPTVYHPSILPSDG